MAEPTELFPGDATFARRFTKVLRDGHGSSVEAGFKPPKGREFVLMLLGDAPAGEAWVDVEKMLNGLGFYRREPGTRVVADEELELLTTAVRQNDKPAALEVLARIAPEAPADAAEGAPLVNADALVTKGTLTTADEALVRGMLDGSVNVTDELSKIGKQLREEE